MLEKLWLIWEDRDLLRELVKEYPFFSPFLFILLQAFQVIIAPLPGEVTGFMAGFLFGAVLGFFLSTTGILIGSAIVFSVLRSFRKHFFLKYESHPFYLRLRRAFKRWGLWGVFLLYLFPGFPKDLLNYFMPFMPLSFKTFLILSTLGRAPGTLALAIQGDVVYGGHPYKIFIVSLSFILVFFLFLIFKKRFEKNYFL